MNLPHFSNQPLSFQVFSSKISGFYGYNLIFFLEVSYNQQLDTDFFILYLNKNKI